MATTSKEINLIACTGDLLDRGGKDYKNIDEAFGIFKEEVILPITSNIGLNPNRFFMTPGNHDIIRDADSELVELGSVELFKNSNKLSAIWIKP